MDSRSHEIKRKRTRSGARLRWCHKVICQGPPNPPMLSVVLYGSTYLHCNVPWTVRRLHPPIKFNHPFGKRLPKLKNFAETQSDRKACSFAHPASVANAKVGTYPVHSCSTSHFPFLHSNCPHHQVRHSKHHPLITFYNRPHLCNPHSRSSPYDTLHSIAGLEPKYNRDYLDQR